MVVLTIFFLFSLLVFFTVALTLGRSDLNITLALIGLGVDGRVGAATRRGGSGDSS